MDKYNWDLTRLFKDEKDFKNAIKEVDNLLNEIVKYKGKILDTEKTLYELLELDSKINLLCERLYVYSHLAHYENMGDVTYQQYKEECLSIVDKASSVTSFITPELLSSTFEDVKKLISKNKKLEKYSIMLERTFRYKSHVLSKEEEKILSDMSEILRVPRSAYDAINNIDIKLDKIKNEKGERVDLTPYNFSSFLMSRDRRVRKDAFTKKYKYYKDHINTISSLYIGKVKSNNFISKTRKYNSILEMELFSDNIDTKLYNNLIDITNKNTKYLKEYYKLKGKSLGYKLHMYDLYVNSSKMPDKKIEYEEGKKLVNEALKPLGNDYLEKFNYLLNNRCVDVYPKDKKRSGAYEWGSYGVLPYVSLNYENNMDSVSTLAHEMGHAMHTYYSDLNQDYLYAGYPIFLAEIASTVNEILLSEYLINNSTKNEEKEYYLVEFLDKFKATVYRQVMFAEFEKEVHETYENGGVLTKDLLCDIYYELNKKQFSPAVKVDETIRYEWARIPHFYDSFYVYKYATGFISALIIADKLLNEKDFKDKYIKFLSSGSIKFPLDLLKDIGIDLADKDTLNRAFEIFNDKINQLKELENGE
ncbi:MAG: oligoendopeptidase F [Bacilli bacterium]|nr:oligoendopeptidase F [Bacilli bacterium]